MFFNFKLFFLKYMGKVIRYKTSFFSMTSLMLVFIFTLVLTSFFDIKYGLDTFWDEGFYIQWLKYPENYKSVTQSFNIINKFGDFSNYSIYYLRTFRFGIQLFTITLFSFLCIRWLRMKYHHLPSEIYTNSLLIIILFGVPSLVTHTQIICFRHLQQLLTLFSLIFFLFFISSSKKYMNYVYLFLSIVSICFSFVNLPTSGGSLICLYCLFVILKYSSNIKKIISIFLFMLLSSIVTMVFVNIYLVNFFYFWPEISKQFFFIRNGNHGHSIIDMIFHFIPIIKLFLFKFIILLLFYATGFFLFQRYKTNLFIYLLSLIYLVISFFSTSFGLDLIFPFALLFYGLGLSRSIFYNNLKLEDLFLFLFPIFASVGSDNIGLTILFFIPSWGLLLASLLLRFYSEILSSIRLVLTSVVLIISLVYYQLYYLETNVFGNYTNSNTVYLENRQLNSIFIRKEQATYFKKVQSILKRTNFNERKDGMFSFSSDYVTIHIFNGRLIGQPYTHLSHYMNDRFDFQAHLEKPKYIFLNNNYISIFSRNNDWDFPEAYDKFFVGSPEIPENSYSQRCLYCLKK